MMKIKGERSFQTKLNRLALELADDANRIHDMKDFDDKKELVYQTRLIADSLQSLSTRIEDMI